MKNKSILLATTILVFTFILVACSGSNENMSKEDSESQANIESNSESNMDDMNHSGSSKVPNDLEKAENPAFEVGNQAIIQADHMKGMKGAEATIKGAYQTTAYVVSYTPTTGGERVENHRWVIHEEIEESGEKPLDTGAEVTIKASHMEGMEGASAVIESAEQTTVYMIDFKPTTGGEKITNHKWVTEDELSAE
ncbi:YdhK family protein [Guptibacillus algicola]|uniref:YdhK family protein n=1 Tax=Guptibacillus algicola TaxID=225844 RepID=UPI001CD7F22A|nr:YdhK family protein [Alkalihalobacillus algicola]MCA0987006.1 YdhK family protein [Alkalihalobacillus algicola]